MLAEHGVLDPALGQNMRRAVAFRDVLVHEYVKVADDVVTAQLDDLDDVRAFVAAISALLTG